MRPVGSAAGLLENVLRSLGDAVILTDGAGNITMCNHAAEELLSLPEAQALRQSCSDVFAATPTVDAMVARTSALGQSQFCGEETLVVAH
ncbi:MAG: PAS domain-containing protein, partial [Candidatus Binatia bacterium]